MTLNKLQLIATAIISSNFKVHWLTWWNSGVHTQSALYFPVTPFSDKDFESWFNRAAFWAGISAFVRYVDLNSKLQLSVFNLCEPLEFSSSALTGSIFLSCLAIFYSQFASKDPKKCYAFFERLT
jgi:hypothetical protein